ncbi:MAG: hypothetical protein M3309_05510 [Actinomycetota bacterium]|jgi:hypothetical protein|nr:hypothetical protein [Actinomycetota bacterium]
MKMRPIPFIPMVTEISAGEAGGIKGLEAVISYWTEGAYSAEEWFDEVLTSWGPAGYVMRRGEEDLGFAVYGPQGYLPHAGRYPVGPLREDAALLAYLRGDARTRRHLLARVTRDLRLRGFGGVEAVASDLGLPRHVPTRFLTESGWKPVRRGQRAGCPYTLMRVDFESTVEVGELARELVGRVRLPVLQPPAPDAPTSALATAGFRAPRRRS